MFTKKDEQYIVYQPLKKWIDTITSVSEEMKTTEGLVSKTVGG